jgi:two-component system invasion response regulator UvrY
MTGNGRVTGAQTILINVLLVDDHDIVRAGIKRLLADVPGINVTASVSSGEDAIKAVREKRPDVILMDVRMPGIGGLEAAKKILRLDSDIKIIALTVCGDEPFPSKFLQIGAFGYLTKGADLEQMVKAIKSVYAGKRYLCPEVAQQLALKTVSEVNSPLDILSERELQIMLMIAQGKKVQEISDHFCISPKTINSYRYRLFDKLSVDSDVELTHLAVRYGLLDMELA